jgi:CRP/FNR family nitrogen fixation transcriptional regulator
MDAKAVDHLPACGGHQRSHVRIREERKLRYIKPPGSRLRYFYCVGGTVMLVRHVGSSRTPVEGHLAALAGERVLCSEFQYRSKIEIFGEGEPAEYVYQITSGSVRTYKLLSDGRRQINAFHLPGDMFGLENGEVHRFAAEAIIDTTVRIARWRSLFGELEQRRSSGLASNLLRLVTKNLQHAEDHMLLLGRKTSTERVAAFLLEMDQRMALPSTMILPMTRRDVADYLGLTLETVSRALSVLRDRGLIRFTCPSQRELMLLDRAKLAKLDG